MSLSIEIFFSVLALIFSMTTAAFGILAYCRVVGLEKSTHKVQYIPAQEYSDFTKEISENIDEDKKLDLEKLEEKRRKTLIKQFEKSYSVEE